MAANSKADGGVAEAQKAINKANPILKSPTKKDPTSPVKKDQAPTTKKDQTPVGKKEQAPFIKKEHSPPNKNDQTASTNRNGVQRNSESLSGMKVGPFILSLIVYSLCYMISPCEVVFASSSEAIASDKWTRL